MGQTPYLQETETNNPPAGSDGQEYSEFISIAVHDLDAPLRKLQVLLEMLMSKIEPTETTTGYMDRIQSCVADMRSLIDDLTVLSAGDTAGLEFEPCEVESILRKCIRELPLSARLAQPLIEIQSPMPLVDGLPDELKRLFRNILDNAIKFAKKDSSPQITISSEMLSQLEKEQLGLSDGTNYFKFRFTDQGIGFREEQADRIFKPFVHLHGKSRFPGNGFGLAICKKIVDEHRGIIYAEGKEQGGAVFTVILPETQQ